MIAGIKNYTIVLIIENRVYFFITFFFIQRNENYTNKKTFDYYFY